jgi:two-component system response regulator GlrR
MTQNARILLVDDDADLLQLLQLRLEAAGYTIETAHSAESARNKIALAPPQLVITDMQMGNMSGMELFEHIHREIPTLPVIILTAHGTIPDAVNATQRGIFGYLTKPFDGKTLLEQVTRALQLSSVSPSGTQGDNGLGIITRNPVMENLLAKIRLVASTDASVLIRGESGTGKELFAQAIHQLSPRKNRPFVAINCSAIPEPLLESELFGHVKGAFTGAIRDHKGLFQTAEGGTIFLDEIGDMPLTLQAKLLRVLQERQVTPIGSGKTLPLDVRILSATHRDLKAEVIAGRFREDIYYRINVIELVIPSLDERREDISLLANHFLTSLANKYHKNIRGFAPEAMEMLINANWPGNVRQLQNVVEQSIALSATPLITATLLQHAIYSENTPLSLEEAKQRFEHDYLVRILKMAGGNASLAARLAQRNRTEFYKLLQRHQLELDVFKPQ